MPTRVPAKLTWNGRQFAWGSRGLTWPIEGAAPVAGFQVTIRGLTVRVHSIASGSSLVHRYTISDGSTYGTADFTHTFAADGIYTITQTVTDAFGSDTATAEVEVTAVQVRRPLNALIKYDIRIYDRSGTEMARFDDRFIRALRYDRLYNDVSVLSAAFADEAGHWINQNLASRSYADYFLEVYRLNPQTRNREKEHTWLLRFQDDYIRDGVPHGAINGHSLEHLLMRRVIDPNDDSRAAGGVVTGAGISSVVVADLVQEHLGIHANNVGSPARRIPRFIVMADGRGEPAGDRWRYEFLLPEVQDLASKGEIQFKMERFKDNHICMMVGQLWHDLRVPTNPNDPADYVLFSERRGNLVNPSFSWNAEKEQNFVYGRSGGNEADEFVLMQAGDIDPNNPYGRIEYTQNLKKSKERESSLQYLTELDVALKKSRMTELFKFEVADSPGARYRVDWDVGDLVTVEYRERFRHYRVMGVQIGFDGREESIDVTMEEYR